MENTGYVIALGTFDGLHKGHEAVLNAALGFEGLTPIAVTFNEPPKRQTTGSFIPMLMDSKLKNQKLLKMGFAEIHVLQYSEIHFLTPKQFLDGLCEKYNVKAFVCGFNYRFGNGGVGDAAYLSSYCHEREIEAVVCPNTLVSGQTVSSTLIRSLISCGNVSFANMLLNDPFSFESTVLHGDERGRVMGFPTANQELDANLVEPKYGVYATSVVVDGREYPAVTNIGIRPTFVLKKPISETYILGFEGELYGKSVTVKLLEYLREEMRFDGIEELKNEIALDCERAKKEFEKYLISKNKNG